MRIAIVGPYPLPYGGISIHVSRVEKLLLQKGVDVQVFKNMNARSWIRMNIGKLWNYDVVHFHDLDWINRTYIGILSFMGVRTILTIHGDSLKRQLSYLKNFKLFLFCYCLRSIKHIVVVKPEIRDLLMSIGVRPSKISIISAYIPPVKDEILDLKEELLSFINNHNLLIVANASSVVSINNLRNINIAAGISFNTKVENTSSTKSLNDCDLYGIDLCIELCSNLVNDYPNMAFLFYIATIGDQSLFERLLLKVEDRGLGNKFRFVIGEYFPPVLSFADLFVRPTYEDGFGFSISEALDCGVPVVVASDVCPRPAGTLLFKSGDKIDFIKIVRQALINSKENSKTYKQPNYRDFSQLLSIYYANSNSDISM